MIYLGKKLQIPRHIWKTNIVQFVGSWRKQSKEQESVSDLTLDFMVKSKKQPQEITVLLSLIANEHLWIAKSLYSKFHNFSRW